MKNRFNDKVLIVTGAASGIGEATARRFSTEGTKVVLVDRQREALDGRREGHLITYLVIGAAGAPFSGSG